MYMTLTQQQIETQPPESVLAELYAAAKKPYEEQMSAATAFKIACRAGIVPVGMVCQIAPEGEVNNILVAQVPAQKSNQVDGD